MTTTLVLHHGGQILLPQGRYWIGDPQAAGIDLAVPASDLDGLYVCDGIVVGVFCRSLFDNAEYGIDDECAEIGIVALGRSRGLSEPPTLRGRGPGIAIVAMDGVPGLGETLPADEIHGFVLDFPCDLHVERRGADSADIEISATGTPIVRLDQYLRRDRAALPAVQPTVEITLEVVEEPTRVQASSLRTTLERLLGKDQADRLRSEGTIIVPVLDAKAGGQLMADLDRIMATHDDHIFMRTALTTAA